MKKYLVGLFLLFCYCFLFTSNASAAQIFQENVTGINNQQWNPSFFVYQSGNHAIYTSNGIIDPNSNDAFYTYHTTNLDSTIKWSVTLNGNYGGVVSCRDSNDVSSEERVIFSNDGTASFNWYYNGGGSSSQKVNVGTTGNHKFELNCTGNNMTLKEDGNIILSTNTNWDNTQQMQMIRLDLFDSTTVLNSYQYCDSGGCPSSDIQISVPLLKQTSNPWQSQLYDSANRWSPGKSTINTWGCALTAATMVMQYYGITKMPDNSPFNPAALNTWLKSQPDGYISVDKNSWGQVNWIALQRLSQIIKLAFNNPNYTADALELKYAPGANKAIVLSDLQNNQPDILEEPGHFVVATGTSGNTFTINDPYFSRNSLTNGYNDTFLNAIRLVPSHTDLSYILFVGPVGMDFSMQNSSGSAVGEEFIQQPLADPTNPSVLSGMPIKIFYLAQPDNDTYTLSVTNSIGSSYNAKAYIYDTTGNVQIFDFSGNGTQSNPDSYIVNFSKTNTHQDTLKKSSIFDSLLSDIQQLYQQNQIKKGTYNELVDEIKEIKNQYNKQHFLQEKIGLAELLIKLIVWNNNHTIPNSAYQTFVGDITFLLTH